jgi:hypothetical protein
MIYKFKSKASGDVIMLGPHGDALLRLLGREPAAKGIVEPAAMPAAIGSLQAAIAAAEAAAAAEGTPEEDAAKHESPVALRQRLWPMIQMLERARAADVPIVWGV